MATLPDPSNRDRLTPQPSMAVASRDAGIVGRGVQAAGQGLSSFGASVTALAKREESNIDNARADEAINKLRQKQLDLTMGTPYPQKGIKGGYVHQKEAQVMVTPEGEKPFLDRHLSQFTSARDEIGASLSGKARERFDSFANNASIDFQMGLLRHATAESDRYQDRQFNETIDTEARAAGAAWDNPRAVVGSMQRVSEAAQRRAEVLGVSPESASQAALALVHESVIDSALASGTQEGSKFAEEHLNNFKETLPEKTLVSLNNRVQAVRKQHIAITTADRVAREIAPVMMPSEFDRAAMNVPDKKAFGDLLKVTGGDLEKAWAASVAGPKALKQAEEKAAKNAKLVANDPTVVPMAWMDFMPPDAKGFVKKNRDAYESGATAPEPTLLEVKDRARRRVLADNPNATVDQIEAAQVKTEQWFNDLRTAKNQNQDRALMGIQQRIFSGEVKSSHDLKPQELAAVGDKRSVINGYINAYQNEQDNIMEASPASTSQYYAMLTNPGMLKGMRVSEVMALAPDVGPKRVNALLQKKAEYDDPTKEKAATIDADLFKAVTYQLGWKDGSDKQKKELIVLKDRVEEELTQRYPQGATRQQTKELLTTLALEFPKVKVPGGGLFGGDVEKARRGMDIKDPTTIVIPEKDKQEIVERARAVGATIQGDSQWREAYRALLAERQMKGR